jgi:hypothetical protein
MAERGPMDDHQGASTVGRGFDELLGVTLPACRTVIGCRNVPGDRAEREWEQRSPMNGLPRRSRLVPLLAAGAVVVLVVGIAVAGRGSWRGDGDAGGRHPSEPSARYEIVVASPPPAKARVRVHLPTQGSVRVTTRPPVRVPVRVTVEGRTLAFAGLRTWSQAAADPSDSRRLLLTPDSDTGLGPCGSVQIAYVIAESPDTMTIALAAYADPDAPAQECPPATRTNVVTATLARPLGDRTVRQEHPLREFAGPMCDSGSRRRP